MHQYHTEFAGTQLNSSFEVVNEIFGLIQKHGLTFCSYTPRSQHDEGWYTKHALFFELKGSFVALNDFLHALEQSGSLLYPEMLRISKVDDALVACSCLFTLVQVKKEEHAKK